MVFKGASSDAVRSIECSAKNSGSPDVSESHHDEDKQVACNQEDEILNRGQVRVFRYMRVAMISALVAVAVAVCLSVFFYTSKDEEQDFHRAFTDQADRVLKSFEANKEQVFSTLRTLATCYTSYSMHGSYSNKSWPMVTLPDMETRLDALLQSANLISVVVFPLVTAKQKPAWELYANQHQGWRAESLAVQRNVSVAEISLEPIVPVIIGVNDKYEVVPLTGEGPFAP
jgi:predicted nucleic acid-binding Zn ribbon protein